MSSAQSSSGARALLSLAPMYAGFQRLVGAVRFRDVVAAEYLRVEAGDRVLDIGCGVGDILESIDDGVEYVGFDPNPSYVAAATSRYGHRATFTTAAVGVDVPADSFSVVIAIGVLHHLDDDDAANLFETARGALTTGGRFVSVDPTFVTDQHRIARALIKADRGQRVRTPEQLEALARPVLQGVKTFVRTDLLRIPYTHAILTASK